MDVFCRGKARCMLAVGFGETAVSQVMLKHIGKCLEQEEVKQTERMARPLAPCLKSPLSHGFALHRGIMSRQRLSKLALTRT